jgi:outer membrane protein
MVLLGRILCIGAAILFGCGSVAMAHQRVSVTETVETALTTSPDIAAQVQALRSLDEGVAQARAGFRPTVSGVISTGGNWTNGSEGRKNTSRRYPSQLSLSTSQPLFDGFQTHYNVKSAEAAVYSGRFSLFQVEQTVILRAITAHIQILTAQQNVRLARNNVDVIKKQRQAARDRFEVGEVTRTDVAQAEAALAQSQANLATQTGALRQAEEAYRSVVGVDPGKLAYLPALPELPQSLSLARETAMKRHPSILAAIKDVESASFQVKGAEGALMPQVNWSGSLTTGSDTLNRNSGVMDAQTRVEISIPLYRGGALRSAVRQNKAAESQRIQGLRATARQINEQVGDAWQELRTARATSSANRSQVKAQKIALEGVREEAKVGSRTTLDVLEAEQQLLNARVSLVRSRANEQVAAYQLLSAIGVLTIETLELEVVRIDPDLYHDRAQDIRNVDTSVDENEAVDWMNNWRP